LVGGNASGGLGAVGIGKPVDDSFVIMTDDNFVVGGVAAKEVNEFKFGRRSTTNEVADVTESDLLGFIIHILRGRVPQEGP
jgi:hypothetical protein